MSQNSTSDPSGHMFNTKKYPLLVNAISLFQIEKPKARFRAFLTLTSVFVWWLEIY